MVEPTHLKNMLVKMGSSSPKFGMKLRAIKNLWNHQLVLASQANIHNFHNFKNRKLGTNHRLCSESSCPPAKKKQSPPKTSENAHYHWWQPEILLNSPVEVKVVSLSHYLRIFVACNRWFELIPDFCLLKMEPQFWWSISNTMVALKIN